MVTMDSEEPEGWLWSVVDLYSVLAVLLYLVLVESGPDKRKEYPTLKWEQVAEIVFLGISSTYIIMHKHPVQGFFCLLQLARDNMKLLFVVYLVTASILYSAIVERKRFIEQPKKIISLYHDVIIPFTLGSLEVSAISIMMAYIITEVIAFANIGISVCLAVTRFFFSAATINVEFLSFTYVVAAVVLYLLYDPVVNKNMSSLLLEVFVVNFVLCYMVVEFMTLSLASVRLSFFVYHVLRSHWLPILVISFSLLSSFCFYKLIVYFLPESNKQARINPWLSALLEILCVSSLFAYLGIVILTLLSELVYLMLRFLQPLLSSWKELLLLYSFAAIVAFVVGIEIKPKAKQIHGSLQLTEVSSMSLEIVTVVLIFLYYGLVLWVMTGGIIIGMTDLMNAVTWLLLEVWWLFYPAFQFFVIYRAEILSFYIMTAIFTYLGQVTAPSIGNKRNLTTERLGMVVICIISAVFAFNMMEAGEIGFLQVAFPGDP